MYLFFLIFGGEYGCQGVILCAAISQSVCPVFCVFVCLLTQPFTTPFVQKEPVHSRCSVSSVHTLACACCWHGDTEFWYHKIWWMQLKQTKKLIKMENQSGQLQKCQRKQVANTLRNTRKWAFNASSVCFLFPVSLELVCVIPPIHIWVWGVSQLGGIMAGISAVILRSGNVFFLEVQDKSKLLCPPGTSHLSATEGSNWSLTKGFGVNVSQHPLKFTLRTLQSGPQGQVEPQSNQKSKKPHPEMLTSLLLCSLRSLFSAIFEFLSSY